jgi:hypothetical protein
MRSTTHIVSIGVLVASGLVPLGASAQAHRIAINATVGSGLSVGGGDGNASLLRSPLFVDVAVRTWNDEDPTLAYGASVRLEVEGRASVAVVPKVELVRELGPLLMRPGLGLPVFFAPFTMAGLELSLDLGFPIGERVMVGGAIMVDAFVIGNDLPEGAAVLMFNGVLGVGVVL